MSYEVLLFHYSLFTFSLFAVMDKRILDYRRRLRFMSTKELTAKVEKELPALMVDKLKAVLTSKGEGFYRDGCIAQLSRQALSS